MQHQIDYVLDGKPKRDVSDLVMKGENAQDTAMASLVGLPLGIFVRLMSEGKIRSTGVHIPTMREVYKPVLAEMGDYGMKFTHRTLEG